MEGNKEEQISWQSMEQNMWQCRKPRSGVKQWRKEERER